MAQWIGQTVIYTTEAGIVPAITLAHYSGGVEQDIPATDATTVDLITVATNPVYIKGVPKAASDDYVTEKAAFAAGYFFVSESVSSLINGDLILSSASTTGIKRGTADTNDWGWRDLEGAVQPKTTGANTPTLGTWRGGNTRVFFFAANDLIDFIFHMPHDWKVGTDLYIHVHWGHNGTNISGSFVYDFHTTFAKGFNQEAWAAEKNQTLTVSSLAIGTTPQYSHRVDEIQLSTSGGSATLLDTDDLETDGMLIVQGVMTTIPTITGSSNNVPAIFGIDIHYQSTNIGTPEKTPDFY